MRALLREQLQQGAVGMSAGLEYDPGRWSTTEEVVELAREQGGRVWAVGTTVVRALESAALEHGLVRAGGGETRLMIAPGYDFHAGAISEWTSGGRPGLRSAAPWRRPTRAGPRP